MPLAPRQSKRHWSSMMNSTFGADPAGTWAAAPAAPACTNERRVNDDSSRRPSPTDAPHARRLGATAIRKRGISTLPEQLEADLDLSRRIRLARDTPEVPVAHRCVRTREDRRVGEVGELPRTWRPRGLAQDEVSQDRKVPARHRRPPSAGQQTAGWRPQAKNLHVGQPAHRPHSSESIQSIQFTCARTLY